MAISSFAQSGEVKDPLMAASLSVIPGLGQFYNGESRKGFLFLDVAVINYILLSVSLLAPNMVQAMKAFGEQYGMKANSGVLSAIQDMHIGSPISLVLLAMVASFVAYAARDAYDHAMRKKRRALYADAIIPLDEAASGSYIIHASIIVALAVMAIFFFVPKPLAKQITEIEFFTSITKKNETTTEKHVISNVSHTATSTHKVDTTKPINRIPQKSELSHSQSQAKASASSSSSASASSSSKSASSASSSAAAAASSAKSSASAASSATKMPNFNPLPIMPRNISHAAATPAIPTPFTPATAIAPAQTMLPQTASSAIGVSQFKPVESHAAATTLAALPAAMTPTGLTHSTSAPVMPVSGSAPAGGNRGIQLPGVGSAPIFNGSKGGSTNFKAPTGLSGSGPASGVSGPPAPVMIPTGHSGPGTGIGNGPVPEAMGRTPGGRKGSQEGSDNGPAPVRSGRRGPGSSGESFGPIAIIPSAGSPVSGNSDKPLNRDGAPGKENTAGSTTNVDFSKYMSDLQRRIKRCWFPTRDTQSLRIKVMFKIHSDGQMSNLRLSAPSHNALADQAALSAVQNASPFAPLPAGAPENVDIEFTFDYNVFSGH